MTLACGTLTTAMILAAGLGTRMQPLTRDRPKALVPVAGQPLIGHILDRLHMAGVRDLVVNTHYQAEILAAFLAAEHRFASLALSPEPVLLETGGGILNALSLLGEDPFLTVNCDSLWYNGVTPPLERMCQLWDGDRMDALLLLHPTVRVPDYDGPGDFRMDAVGRLLRRPEQTLTPFVYTGVQLLHPRLFAGIAPGRFSLNRLYDRAIAAGRLYGLSHDGLWFHVGTPADVMATERALRA
jgi:N-acetyl-alpha-D-muramate 1-phosphate uridylyltransferase